MGSPASLSVASYRERHSRSGAKSDAGDAHMLPQIVRLDRDHHRRIAGDSESAEAIKVVTRAHQTRSLIVDSGSGQVVADHAVVAPR